MSAFKPITIYRPRKNVIAKFRLTDGINLPKQTVLFADLSQFREYARRISATTLGKFNYDIAEYAVDNELPKPSYNSKEVRFHYALREDLIKKRQDFIESKKLKPIVTTKDRSAKTLDDVYKAYFTYVETTVTNEGTLNNYKAYQKYALNLMITHDRGFTKRLGEYHFEEIEFDIDGTGYKIVSMLRDRVRKKRLKETSLYSIQQQAKRYFKYLKLKKYIIDNLQYPKVSQPKPESVPFSEEELQKFETFCSELYKNPRGITREDKNFMRGFYLARFTGARAHEIAHLQIKHWYKDSAEHSHFKLPKAKGKKVEKGDAGVLLASNDILIEFLDKDFQNRDKEEFILSKPNGTKWYTHSSSYTNTFRRALNSLGIFGKQPWHAFRHTGAIELFEITGDIYQVKTFLRHELLETVKRYLNSNRVDHVVEKSQNFIGKKYVRTARNQKSKNLLEGGKKIIEINPIKEVA